MFTKTPTFAVVLPLSVTSFISSLCFFLTPVLTRVWSFNFFHDSRLSEYTQSLPTGHNSNLSPLLSSPRLRCERRSSHWDPQRRGVEEETVGEEKEGRERESSAQVLLLYKFCKWCIKGWVVWSDSGLTRTELKPLTRFFEEFANQGLNLPTFLSQVYVALKHLFPSVYFLLQRNR